MMLTRQSKILVELSTILFEVENPLTMIAENFGIQFQKHGVFVSLLKFVIECCKYALKTQSHIEQNGHQGNPEQHFTEVIDKFLRLIHTKDIMSFKEISKLRRNRSPKIEMKVKSLALELNLKNKAGCRLQSLTMYSNANSTRS